MSKETPGPLRRQPKQSRALNTVDTILQAAEELFVSKGFHNTTSEDIVKRAGTSIGSLYDYFPNKTSIALALLENVSMSIAVDSKKYFMEYGKQPLETSLPQVIRRIFEGYKRHKNVLINLVNDVPELRSAAELYSIDKLIHRASLIYLQIYEDRFDEKGLAVAHSFLTLLFGASIKQYLAETNHLLSENDFLNELTLVILLYIQHPAVALPKPMDDRAN